MPLDVQIKDFQSLKDVKLRVEKFTVLIGRNNLGKSAVARALRGVAKNKGDATRIGSKFNEVTLSDETFKIIRKKGPNHNDYQIKRTDQEVAEYTKVNRDVPSEIAELGFKSIQVGRDKVLVQFPNQFEKIFLLDRPASVVAEVLSKISNIEVINQALRLANRDRKQKESLLKIRRIDLEKTKQRLTHFDQIGDLNILSAEIKELKQKHTEIEQVLTRLEAYLLKLKEYKAKILKSSQVSLVLLPKIDFEQFEQFKFLSKSLNTLGQHKRRLESLERIKLVEIPKFSKIIDLSNETSFVQTKLVMLDQSILSVKTSEEELIRVKDDSIELEKEIEELRQTEECPFKGIFKCKMTW
jgi:energy-coupling factor transporter ATP-binding protein EcfA2